MVRGEFSLGHRFFMPAHHGAGRPFDRIDKIVQNVTNGTQAVTEVAHSVHLTQAFDSADSAPYNVTA